ncbi:hypothetical protein [Pontibacter chinhatensis]|uniref:Uncharacterized protein n=1 Tax=Pontibacter chinhatensis TaxID=1436961 RepID=A0A1I2ZHJ0_9BACT|nr:hypothetical protein [Pontibacter chinhatensis]SFH37115.1 hypothetical protein SAMN05421739_1146 [Pontibacter chinhatensis]
MKRVALVLFCSLALSSCVNEEFFQHDALATEEELNGKAAAGPDSAWVILGRHYDRSGFHRFFWGDHHRPLWTTPVKLPVFKLEAVNGGLQVVKKGGGYQTTSFQLQDRQGRLYAFRSLDKDPKEVVSPFWQGTFVTNVLRDQTSAANPFGALVVPPLASAVGVYHPNPKLYYVAATDTSFGEFSQLVQGKVFMLEEKYDSPTDITPVFSSAVVNFEDSEDALRKRFLSNSYHFNQEAIARARLLDLLIGDWDRHKGQWDWAVTAQGADTTYFPVPKDRDQVFLKMNDGVIPFIATSKLLGRKFHTFDHDFSDVKAYMLNAAFIDERLLHELSREDWRRVAQEMQQQLTEAVIDKAVNELPQPIYTLVGPEMARNLKSRRDLLPKAAAQMYAILAKKVTIPGSDAPEQFAVRRLGDGDVEVIVTRPATGAALARQLYKRIFKRGETEEIILHGLAGDDEFILSGQADESIFVTIYGGLGEDEITDNSSVSGWKKYTQVFDTERGNEIHFGTEARDKTTKDVRVHAYDREGN